MDVGKGNVQALEKQLALQELALEQAIAGIYVIDYHTDELYYANKVSFELHGASFDEEYSGKKCYEAFYGLDKPCKVCWRQNIREDGKNMVTMCRKDEKCLSISAEKKVWDGKEVLAVVMRNITENIDLQNKLRKMLQKTKREEEILQQACELAGVWVWIYDMPNNCIYPGHLLRQDFDMPEVLDNFPESWLKMGFIQPEYIQLHRNKVQEMKAGAQHVEFECRIVHKDGSLHWTSIRFRRLKNDPNKAICIAQLIDDQRDVKAKTEFLSRMSHEIRTPMNAIIGMTSIAQENKSDFVQVTESLDKIQQASRYLLVLINDILEMSRIESGKVNIKTGTFDLNLVLEGVATIIEPLALKSEIRYEQMGQSAPQPFYQGDGLRVQQILVNLINNAVKFTKPKGRVRFTLRIDEDTAEKTSYSFIVADTGIGMSQAFLEKLYQPFSQADSGNTSKFGGSGLGLAISKKLVEAMGGSISVESFEGLGTTFTVKLTFNRIEEKYLVREVDVAELAPYDDSILQGKRVLIAEDHPLNVLVARKLLERKGVEIEVASNGKLAVNIFDQNKLHHFDAILMDIRMPIMDGLEATKAIRSLDRPDALTIPIIAMTANALEEDRGNSRAAGMNAHLAKPFEPEQLYRVLIEQLRRRG